MPNDRIEQSRVEELESRLITVALVVALAVSLADNLFNFIGNQNWTTPLIFLTMLIFLRWLDVTRRRVMSIATGAPLRVYDSSSAFYGEALHAISRSSKSVYAVFSHAKAPPQQTEESRRYYTGTIRWARKTPGKRYLHRVIRLPYSSPDIQEWVDEQVDLAEKIENYHVRVLRYPPGMELEGENFAIIDSSVVFLGFAVDDRGELHGFSVRDAGVAAAFEHHFRELWRLANASPTAPPQQRRPIDNPDGMTDPQSPARGV
ncbi:hypothetical protein [Micromonospora endolithica]|uniref:Uncharacterized protein n=1 Tax=Micromonospora endolithica TaxID=230091 RepID=A0A3A9Z581_9ACTN|nr:hypothetical protein [Micromonospora endolithica]RKN43475.1 hypothetical protein D7223_20745 [Micromonospora endolithica]TWJ24056.1 hypothetical protein JD76_04202 [Micromonospora endolithica]